MMIDDAREQSHAKPINRWQHMACDIMQRMDFLADKSPGKCYIYSAIQSIIGKNEQRFSSFSSTFGPKLRTV